MIPQRFELEDSSYKNRAWLRVIAGDVVVIEMLVQYEHLWMLKQAIVGLIGTDEYQDLSRVQARLKAVFEAHSDSEDSS